MLNDDPARVLNSSVLVLNRFFMAIHLVNVRRAFALLYRENAEVVDCEDGRFANYDFQTWCELSEYRSFEMAEYGRWTDGDWVRCVSFAIQAPLIIRLKTFEKVPRPTMKYSRRHLFARDGHQCQYCGEAKPSSQLSVDHVMPRSRGGATTWENVVCSCITCNTKKGGRTPKEARMKLIRSPAKPKHNPLLVAKLKNPKYSSWQSFLPALKAERPNDRRSAKPR